MIKQDQCNDDFYFSLNISLKFIGVALLVLVFISKNAFVYAEEREEYEMINITAGQIGVLDNMESSQRYGLEYRFKSFSGPYGFRLIPAVGAAVSNDGAGFFMVI